METKIPLQVSNFHLPETEIADNETSAVTVAHKVRHTNHCISYSNAESVLTAIPQL